MIRFFRYLFCRFRKKVCICYASSKAHQAGLISAMKK